MSIRAKLIAATTVASIAMLAAPATAAHADSSGDFIKYLAANGEPANATPELAFRAIDVGQAICGLLNRYQSVSRTLDFMVNNGEVPKSPQNARLWLVGSVAYLCPENAHLPT